MDVNGEAIYGTTSSPFDRPLPWGRCTKKASGNRTTLYLHVFDWPADGRLLVPALENKIQRAYLLADKSHKRLATKNTSDGVIVTLPIGTPNPISTTVVLRIKGLLIVSTNLASTAAANLYGNRNLY